LSMEEVWWSRHEEMFIYNPLTGQDRGIRKPVKSKRGETKVGLLHVTEKKGRVVRCRHLAMTCKFRDVGDRYYLQVDPTWYFSRDGRKHPRSEDLIRTIRIIQKEKEYHATLRLWREVLTQQGDLVRQEYPFLSFGDYMLFEAPVSIPDPLWKSTADPEVELDVEQGLLKFDE
jgi:hypothetical protein